MPYSEHKLKASIAINYTFLFVLALLILMVLVGFSIFLGGRAEEMINSLKALIPMPE